MLPTYLERGVVAGAIAGLAYGVYVVLVGNPLVEYVDELGHHGAGHGHVVGETTTAAVSAGSGVLWGILLGGCFGLAYYLFEPALPGRGAVKAAVLAGAGFLTVSVTPWLVLPPAAPGAREALGIRTRLLVYAGLMLLGALVSAVAILAARRAAVRGRLPAVLAGAAPVVALVAVVPSLTPTIVTHPTLPGDLVAAFQGLVVLSQAGLWIVLATTFARLQVRGRHTGAASLEDEPSVGA